MRSFLKSPERHRFLLLIILALGTFLRLFQLGSKPFWSDEGVAWWMAQGEVPVDAPLIYHYAFNWSQTLFGWQEFAGRFPSVIFGILTIAVLYAIGKELFDSAYGLRVAFLAALSAYLIPVAQEMRIYSLLGLELLLALWCFLKLIQGEENNTRGLWGLLGVGIIGQYTHCFFIFILLYFGVVLFLLEKGRNLRLRLRYVAVVVSVFLISLPEVLKSLSVASDRPQIYALNLAQLGQNLFQMCRFYFSFLWGDYLTNLPGSVIPYLQQHPGRLVVSLFMLLLAIVLVWLSAGEIIRMIRQKSPRRQGIKILLGGLVGFTLVFLFVNVSSSAHLIFVYLPFILLVALVWSSRNTPWRRALLILIILLNGVSLVDYYASPTFAGERADWRQASQILRQERKAGEPLLLLRARDAYYTLKFYDPELGGEIIYARRHLRQTEKDDAAERKWRSTSPEVKIREILQSHPRIWVLESELNWNPEKEEAAYRLIKSWDFGFNLQVHLIER